MTIAQTPPFIITNIVPGDFNHDGKLDVLVMGQADPVRNPNGELMMRVYLGNIDSGWSTFQVDTSHMTVNGFNRRNWCGYITVSKTNLFIAV